MAIRALVKDPAAWLRGVIPRGPARAVDVDDRYLDTAAGALRNAGLAARIRTSADGRRLTLKSLGRRGSGAVHRRLELEGNAGDPGQDDPRTWPSSPARDHLIGAIGGDRLVTVAILRQRRLQQDVTIGSSVVELSLDEIEVGAGSEPVPAADHWFELECELQSGDETDLAALGRALAGRPDVVPASTSKLERALLAGHSFTER